MKDRLKDAYYFSHDKNARIDPKIMMLLRKHGFEGYGLYWALIECLSEATNSSDAALDYKLLLSAREDLAFSLHLEPAKLTCFIDDCIEGIKLFRSDGQHYWSESLIRRMGIKEAKREAKASAGKKGAENRWQPKDGAMAEEMAVPFSENSSAISQDSKVKESKVNESKEKVKVNGKAEEIEKVKVEGKDREPVTIPTDVKTRAEFEFYLLRVYDKAQTDKFIGWNQSKGYVVSAQNVKEKVGKWFANMKPEEKDSARKDGEVNVGNPLISEAYNNDRFNLLFTEIAKNINNQLMTKQQIKAEIDGITYLDDGQKEVLNDHTDTVQREFDERSGVPEELPF